MSRMNAAIVALVAFGVGILAGLVIASLSGPSLRDVIAERDKLAREIATAMDVAGMFDNPDLRDRRAGTGSWDEGDEARLGGALYQLEIAKKMPNEHEKQMWIMAAWMALHGYCWTDTTTPIEPTVPDLCLATAGVRQVSPPDAGPLKVFWKINRDPEGGSHSWLDVHGESTVEPYTDDNTLAVSDVFEKEWREATPISFPHQVDHAVDELLLDAEQIYRVDRGDPGWTWDGSPSTSDTVIEQHGWSGSEAEGGRWYRLALARPAGDYLVEINLNHTVCGPDGPSCGMTLCFTYKPGG